MNNDKIWALTHRIPYLYLLHTCWQRTPSAFRCVTWLLHVFDANPLDVGHINRSIQKKCLKIRIYAHIDTYSCIHMYTYIQIYAYTHTHTPTEYSLCVCVRACVCAYSHNLKRHHCLVFADVYQLHRLYTCQRALHLALTNTFQRRNWYRLWTLLHLYSAPQRRSCMVRRLGHDTWGRTCIRIQLCLLQGCCQNRPDMWDSPSQHHCQKCKETCQIRSRHSL